MAWNHNHLIISQDCVLAGLHWAVLPFLHVLLGTGVFSGLCWAGLSRWITQLTASWCWLLTWVPCFSPVASLCDLVLSEHGGFIPRRCKWKVPIFWRSGLRRSLPLHSIGHSTQLQGRLLYREGEINSTSHGGRGTYLHGRKELMVTIFRDDLP